MTSRRSTAMTAIPALVLSLAAASLATPASAEACSDAKPAAQSAQVSGTEAVRYVSHHQEAPDIVDLAAASGSFSTLLAAADTAGLVDALKGDGPLTVFAPTDAAFAALPEGTVETLLKPENKNDLAAILKLHVIAGAKIPASALSGNTLTVETLGGMVTIDGTHGIRIDRSNVISADLEAANGIIHVIDAVILPAT